ncbi:hypothetical protein CIB48_g10885 [Xylaria polymorpha]|nr:hypothetical protein CIB48_g10885 [Xylaria polymorpha]
MATAPHPSDPDVVEGFDALETVNSAITDKDGHPLVDIRIKHTIVLDDPYPDPSDLREPSQSPQPSKAQLATVRIAEDDAADLDREVDQDAAEKLRREREARAQALTLEMMGDLPFAEVKPPENILFVCKLNPVTADTDLELIFSRFGKILSCEVIRDKKTGDSLQYAFIEFEDKSACEAAYFKMQGVLIDDRRIHVDFSQSVSKLADVWRGGENAKRKGNEEDGRGNDHHYSMVYGEEEMRGRHQRQRDEDDHRAGPSDDLDRRAERVDETAILGGMTHIARIILGIVTDAERIIAIERDNGAIEAPNSQARWIGLFKRARQTRLLSYTDGNHSRIVSYFTFYVLQRSYLYHGFMAKVLRARQPCTRDGSKDSFVEAPGSSVSYSQIMDTMVPPLSDVHPNPRGSKDKGIPDSFSSIYTTAVDRHAAGTVRLPRLLDDSETSRDLSIRKRTTDDRGCSTGVVRSVTCPCDAIPSNHATFYMKP